MRKPGVARLTAARGLAVAVALCCAGGFEDEARAEREAPPVFRARVQNVACMYGGSVPALFVTFDIDARTPLTNVRASSVLLGDGARGWSAGVTGDLTLRERPATPRGQPEAMPVAFSGALAVGSRKRLEAFGRLNLAAFSGAGYPNESLEFRLVLRADQGQFVVTGPRCTVGFGG